MEKKHCITYNSPKEKAFTVHLPNKEVNSIKSSNGLYYHKPTYNTNLNKDKTTVNHTIIPITSSTKNFVHVIIARVDENINFAGVARNTTKNNNINTNKLAEISKDKPSKTLVEFMENNTQAKKPKENGNVIIKIDLQNKVDMAKKTEIKEDKGKESIIKYCTTNATFADISTKPLTKANIRKIRKMIKSIIGQQECVGARSNKY
jgi:hypothetical protein